MDLEHGHASHDTKTFVVKGPESAGKGALTRINES